MGGHYCTVVFKFDEIGCSVVRSEVVERRKAPGDRGTGIAPSLFVDPALTQTQFVLSLPPTVGGGGTEIEARGWIPSPRVCEMLLHPSLTYLSHLESPSIFVGGGGRFLFIKYVNKFMTWLGK